MAANLEQRLNEVIAAGMPHVQYDGLASQFNDGGTKISEKEKIIDSYVNTFRPDLPEEMRKKIAEELKTKTNPIVVNRMMEASAKESGENLSKIVEANYDALVKGLKDQDYLLAIALAVSGKEKEFENITTKIKEKEFDSVRKKYASTFKDKAWKIFIEQGASDDFIKIFAPMHYQIELSRFAEQFMSAKGENEKKENYLDSAKISDYISGRISACKDDKEKQKMYVTAGKAISSHYMNLLAEKEAKKQAEEKEKKAA